LFPLLQFSKETRQARWRAYAKGCVDVSETSSQKAMDGRAKLNDVAPKDVKQLEILKPINTPSMAERYKQALEKEKRLEAASRSKLARTGRRTRPKTRRSRPRRRKRRRLLHGLKRMPRLWSNKIKLRRASTGRMTRSKITKVSYMTQYNIADYKNN
jgi:hypothetical protein